MKNLKKVSIAALGMLAMISTNVLAKTGTVDTPMGLILREDADRSSNAITTIPDKTQVDIIEDDGEWYKVRYNNQEGYLFAGYVEENEAEGDTQTSSNGNNTTQNANSTLKVYAIPLITSTVINEIQANETITIEKRITNWSYVSVGEITGWVRSYGIENTVQTSAEPNTQENPQEEPETKPTENNQTNEPQNQQTTENPETNTQSPEESNTLQPSNSEQTEKVVEETKAYVDVDFANIRKEASTNSEIVTTLTEGTSFIITAETEEWYKIRYTSVDEEIYEGYIYKELTRK